MQLDHTKLLGFRIATSTQATGAKLGGTDTKQPRKLGATSKSAGIGAKLALDPKQ